MSDGDGVDRIESFAGVLEGFFDNGINCLDVTTGGDFWDDATVLGVDVDLRHNNIGQDFLSVLDNRGGGFVAR